MTKHIKFETKQSHFSLENEHDFIDETSASRNKKVNGKTSCIISSADFRNCHEENILKNQSLIGKFVPG